jgi:hypothetical protein
LAEEFSFHSLCSDHASEKKPGLVFSYRRVVAVVQTKIQYDACLPFPSNKLIEVFWQNGRLDRAPLRNMLGSQKSLGKEDQRTNFSQFFFFHMPQKQPYGFIATRTLICQQELRFDVKSETIIYLHFEI